MKQSYDMNHWEWWLKKRVKMRARRFTHNAFLTYKLQESKTSFLLLPYYWRTRSLFKSIHYFVDRVHRKTFTCQFSPTYISNLLFFFYSIFLLWTIVSAHVVSNLTWHESMCGSLRFPQKWNFIVRKTYLSAHKSHPTNGKGDKDELWNEYTIPVVANFSTLCN